MSIYWGEGDSFWKQKSIYWEAVLMTRGHVPRRYVCKKALFCIARAWFCQQMRIVLVCIAHAWFCQQMRIVLICIEHAFQSVDLASNVLYCYEANPHS